MRPALAALTMAIGAVLSACTSEATPPCFMEAPHPDFGPPPPRTVLREADYSTGCIIVPVEIRHFVLPQGETSAGSLIAEGDEARLTLTGVHFGEDGSQERRTVEATFALPLTIPATSVAARMISRRVATQGAAVEETVVPLPAVRIDALEGGRVQGSFWEGDFDGPVAVSGL